MVGSGLYPPRHNFGAAAMDTKTFLESVLSDEGHPCLITIDLTQKSSSPKHYWFKNIDELIAKATEVDTFPHNVYFATSTYNEEGSQWAGRTKANVKSIKAFWLDLDCGEGKEFPTQADAIRELQTFKKSLGLPAPITVNSGNGIHVYWPLSEAITREEWEPVASKLGQLCREHNFPADASRTTDAASILRLPNTNNYKKDPPLPVALLGKDMATPVDLSEFIEKLGGVAPKLPALDLGPDALQEALNENKEFSFGRIMRKTSEGNGCEQLKHITIHQNSVDEPLWRAGLSITKFCKEGEKAAIKISNRHDSYDEEFTLKKFNEIKGPYLCAKFNELNPDVCEGCSHWEQIKTPLVLGQRIKAASGPQIVSEKAANSASNVKREYTIPEMPKPYFGGEHGGIYVRVRDGDDLVDKMIYRHTFYVSRRLYDQEQGELVVFRLHLPRDGVREFTLPLTVVTAPNEFRKAMSKEGVTAINPAETTTLMTYTNKWITELQQTVKADEAHRQFGWADEEMTGFVLGDKLIRPDRVEYNPSSPSTASLFPSFGEKGSRERHIEMINFYNKPEEDWCLHQFNVCAGFGSVLMPFTGMNSLAIHLTGASGVGKTTAQMMGLAAWGSPFDIMNRQEDTHNSRMNRGEVLKNLPLISDEMTDITPAIASEYLYQMTGGRQKNRLAQSGNVERARGKPWELLALSSANSSMWDIASSHKADAQAELLRLFEIQVPEMVIDTESKKVTDKLFEEVKVNYGWLGTEFVQWVMNNKEEVRKVVDGVRTALDEAAGLTSKHRFWSAGVAVTIAAAIILKKKLGIVEYDTKRLFEWSVKQLILAKARLGDAKSSTNELLGRYLAEKWNNILWINDTEDSDGELSNISSLVPPAEKDPRSFIVARYETTSEKLYLLPTPLKDWCVKNQINYSEFLKKLKVKFDAKSEQKRIFADTYMGKTPSVKTWSITYSMDNENGVET